MTDSETCWFRGPKHDWVPVEQGWICDRCEAVTDD